MVLHHLFDSVSEDTEEFVDTVAERIVVLGGDRWRNHHSCLPTQPIAGLSCRHLKRRRSRRSVIDSVGHVQQGCSDGDQLWHGTR